MSAKMLPKSRVIDTIIFCLRQKAGNDFKQTKEAIYTGLSDLLELYALENKTEQFFEAFELLCLLPNNYQLGTYPVLDNFIIQLEKVFHVHNTKKSVQHSCSWWKIERNRLLNIAASYAPCYVYHRPTQIKRIKQLKALKSIDTLFYAMKANPHPEILKTLEKEGVGFECVSIQEVQRILELFPGIEKKRILFTPNFAPKIEYEAAIKIGCYLTVDSLYPLVHWNKLFENQRIIVRIDPGSGAGHHKHVLTGGNESKFGIAQQDIEQLVTISKQQNIQIIGLHSHSGSGILTPELWEQTALMLTFLAEQFPHVQFINLGGGLGIVEKPGQSSLNLAHLDSKLLAVKSHHVKLQFWMEPGRFFVAESGVLLTQVTQSKEKGDVHFIGVDTGMNSLIRPSLYGAYHEIVNLSRLDAEESKFSHIVGPICESGDTLGHDRLLPITQERDIILIANSGAYGHCMSSHYNLRPPAQEIILDV